MTRTPLAWWVACLLWSSTFLFIRIGLADIPPFTFAGSRLAIALAVLGPIAWRGVDWRAISRHDLVSVCGAGIMLLGVNYALTFWGAQFVPSGLVAILQSGTPMIALAMGWLMGSERVTARKAVALTAGIIGVAIIFGAEAMAPGTDAVAGAVAVFGGSLCVAFAYVWLKTHGHHVPRSAVTALQTVAALVPLAVLALLVEGAPRPSQWSVNSWAALLYLGLVASVRAELLVTAAHRCLGDADDGRRGSTDRAGPGRASRW